MAKFISSSIMLIKISIWQTRLACVYFLSSIFLLFSIICTPVFASIDVYEFGNNAQEQQYRRLIDEFRCPKCQNQNLASSNSGIAEDLKRKTYQMVTSGKSDTEIRTFMVERYGDFVTYNPPVRPSTYILWYLPPTLLLLAIAGWLVKNHSKIIGRKIINGDNHLKNTQLTDIEQAKLDNILNQHGCQGNQQIDADNKQSRDIKNL